MAAGAGTGVRAAGDRAASPRAGSRGGARNRRGGGARRDGREDDGRAGDRPAQYAPAQRARRTGGAPDPRSEEHTSELQSLMRISYAVFCLKKKNNKIRMSSSIRTRMT